MVAELPLPSTSVVEVRTPYVEHYIWVLDVGSGGEASDSTIVKRMRNEPHIRHPSILQLFPYVNPTSRFRKGKCKCTKMYTSRKCTKAPAV